MWRSERRSTPLSRSHEGASCRPSRLSSPDTCRRIRFGCGPEIPQKRIAGSRGDDFGGTKPRLTPDVIVEAVRGHFIYEGEQVERRLREHVRRGQMILGVGLTVLVVFLTLAELTLSLPTGHLRRDPSRGVCHYWMGRDVAPTRSPALRLVAADR